MTLADLEKGTSAQVKTVDSENQAATRLMEMGVLPGTRLKVVKSAPFGDPIQIRIKGYDLALRLNEAKAIEVAKLES